MNDASPKLFDCRDSWAATIEDLATQDERVVVVVNDSVGSSKLGKFQKRFPERTVNVGIAEQNQVGVAAGLANGGRIPFVSCAGPFLTARAMEQIKVDVAYSENNVTLVSQSPGVAYGELGPTHHSIEDLTWMRSIPGMTVFCPADPTETEQVIRWAAQSSIPAYVRISRMPVPEVYPSGYIFEPGKAVRLREGDDLTIVATGTTVHIALAASDALAGSGISARVLAMTSVKPLDEEELLAAASETGRVLTVEEGLVTGLGGAVAEFLSERCPVPVQRIGFRDTFAETGSVEWLFSQQGISVEGIAEVVHSLMNEPTE